MATPTTADGTAKKMKWVWKCSVCGYLETGYLDGLPNDYRCPVCNAKPKKFSKVQVEV